VLTAGTETSQRKGGLILRIPDRGPDQWLCAFALSTLLSAAYALSDAGISSRAKTQDVVSRTMTLRCCSGSW
jgi:hypothetical protein